MLLSFLFAYAVLAQEQQQPPVLPDNGAMPADDFDQPDDMGTNDVGEASALIQTNSSGQISDNSGSNRRRRTYRRRSSQPSSYSSSRDNSPPGPDTIDERSGRPSYQNFRIVTERNIFDPNRNGYRPRPGPTRSSDYFALVGTMSYEKGLFAFFDGTSSEYRKALKLGDSIADYKVTNITPNTVNIASGTNQVELRVGMQMRREEQGPWSLGSSSQTFANTPESTASAASPTDPNAPPPAPGSLEETLKKLRERREKE